MTSDFKIEILLVQARCLWCRWHATAQNLITLEIAARAHSTYCMGVPRPQMKIQFEWNRRAA